MDRRSFFKSVLVGVGALACWPFLKKAKEPCFVSPSSQMLKAQQFKPNLYQEQFLESIKSDNTLTLANIRRAKAILDEEEEQHKYIRGADGRDYILFYFPPGAGFVRLV